MTSLLIERALTLLDKPGRSILGIAGAPGSGKSTAVARLLAELRMSAEVAWIPMDGFHLADHELQRKGILGRKGGIETFDAYGYLATLRRARIEVSNPVYAPEFDRVIEQPIAGGMAVLPGTRLIVTEGNYLLDDAAPWPSIRAELDECWFCECDDIERRRRLIARHISFGKSERDAERWVDDVDEINAVRIQRAKASADLVFDNASFAPH